MGRYGNFQNFNSDQGSSEDRKRNLSKNMYMRFSPIRMLISKVELLFKVLNDCALVNPYKLQRCVQKPVQSGVSSRLVVPTFAFSITPNFGIKSNTTKHVCYPLSLGGSLLRSNDYKNSLLLLWDPFELLGCRS